MAGTKNILAFFYGTRGDVMPGVCICKALEARGHKVTMAVLPGLQEGISAYGIRCVTLGTTPFKWRDDYAVMPESEVQVMRRSRDPGAFVDVANRHGLPWNAGDFEPEAIRACAELVDREGIDVLVCNFYASLHVCRIAMARKDLACIITTFSPGAPGSPPTNAFVPADYEMSSIGFVNKLKHLHHMFTCFLPTVTKLKVLQVADERLLGVEGIDHSQGMEFYNAIGKYPVLGLWSEHIIPRPDDYPENHQVVGSVFPPAVSDWRPSPALEAFVAQRDAMGRAPLLITFGSMMGTSKVEEALIQAAKKMGMNVVLCRDRARQNASETANFSFVEASAGQASEECVFEVDYVPHDWLMPRVSATVSHGGAGTVFRSLSCGIPCVICPMVSPIFCDQLFHAQYVHRRGLGAWLEPLTPSADECEVALGKALGCTPACAELAAKIGGEDGAANAAVAIERIVREKEAERAASSAPKSIFACCLAAPGHDSSKREDASGTCEDAKVGG